MTTCVEVIITARQSNDDDVQSLWKLDKADWCTFSEACTELNIANIKDNSIKSFTEKLISIAENSIPKSKQGKHTINTVSNVVRKCKRGQSSHQHLKTWNSSESDTPNAEILSEH